MVKPVLKILLTISLLTSGTLTNAKISQSSLDTLQESLEQLVSIKSSSQLPSEEKQIVEIEARKTAFNRVLDLDTEELGGLRKKLEKLTNAERLKHLNTIEEYRSYYEIIRGQINKEINLVELVEIATGFKKWRETIYNKELTKIVNFILIFQNQEVIKIAENRLNRITRDFKFIKSHLMPNQWGLAEKLVDDAGKLINEAKTANVELQTQKITSAYKNFIILSEMVK